MFCVLRGLNLFLRWGIQRAIHIKPDGAACCKAAEPIGLVLRAGLLLGIGIPYVLAMVMVYRPRLMHAGTPQTVLSVPYEQVSFKAIDGVQLEGWWIPAAYTSKTDRRHPASAWGQRTIILCHGFSGDKATEARPRSSSIWPSRCAAAVTSSSSESK